MVDRQRSVSPTVFEGKYRADPDPWSYASSPYEQAKYRASLDAVGQQRFRSVLEIGCSIGVFTEMLAPLCDRLLAIDAAKTAVERARERCASLKHVRVEQMQVPQQFPEGSFDLVVLSEIGYYWSRADLLSARRKIVEHLDTTGLVLLVHWTPLIGDAPLTGDDVHTLFASSGNMLENVLHRQETTYRLDLFQKR